MFGPWITVAILALGSSEVIGLRVAKLSHGGVDAENEAHLLVNEKIVAVFDAGIRLVCGATTSHVINRFGSRSRRTPYGFQPNASLRLTRSELYPG